MGIGKTEAALVAAEQLANKMWEKRNVLWFTNSGHIGWNISKN